MQSGAGSCSRIRADGDERNLVRLPTDGTANRDLAFAIPFRLGRGIADGHVLNDPVTDQTENLVGFGAQTLCWEAYRRFALVALDPSALYHADHTVEAPPPVRVEHRRAVLQPR